MPRYLVQTASGSWYQVDTEEPKVLRLSRHGISDHTEAKGDWQDMRVTKFHYLGFDEGVQVCVYPDMPMRFLSKGAWVTTAKVISRVIIEDISKNRIPFENKARKVN